MKIKILKDKNGRELLKVSLTKKDSFDYATASHLTASSHRYLLPFSFSGKEALPNLYYDLTNCLSLKTFMGSKISGKQFESIITQLVSALDSISTGSLSQKNLLLEPSHVFIKAEGTELRLAYLPLTSREVNDRAVLNLLLELAQGARFITEEAREDARKFLDFLKQQSVFSVIEMQAYFGMRSTLPDTKHSQSLEKPAATSGVLGRDFVSEGSGRMSMTQTTEQRSTSDNIIAAISENFNAPEEARRAHPVVAIPVQEPIAPQTGPPEPSSVATAATASTKDTGTTSLASWSTPLREESADVQVNESYWLVRVSDGMKWKLPEGSTVIGRSKACNIQVSDSTAISRQHATLVQDNKGLAVYDKESRNGTFVDGVRISSGQAVSLKKGSTFSLGSVQFTIAN
ncbi:MAG: FHA domain-containing protein [Coriobacteriia bacterium]|nr:FHA domain-containing protein [Coriobacteriia bacterium]MCL2749704.1 FHA domain-containing protein [Coriobacteriia bacterium]